MPYTLMFTREASGVLQDLGRATQYATKLKKVNRALGLIQADPRYPGLHSHKYTSLRGSQGETVWDSYVENKTSSAWRIFWHYGPGENVITIVTIGPHP